MKKAIYAPKIFDGSCFLEDQTVLIEDGFIADIVAKPQLSSDWEVVRFTTGTLAPGFIDWQVNGGGGVLFNNDISVSGIQTMVSAHHHGGTTSLMPTLITDTEEKRKRALQHVKMAIADGNNSVIGLHLEGPFFSLEKRGVHSEKLISKLSQGELDWLCASAGVPLLVTLAPEKIEMEQLSVLTASGVTVNIGHSNADSVLVNQALSLGVTGFTHLYNAMSNAVGREPGVVGAALLDEHSWCGIIVDGHHVHPDMVALAHKLKPVGKMCLVTDSMATVFSETKKFDLYGETISERDGRLVNAQGRLAGSCISMIDAVRIAHTSVGLALDECLRMASLNSAQYLNIGNQLGRIKPCYRADMVFFDDDFNVVQTWVAGEQKLDTDVTMVRKK